MGTWQGQKGQALVERAGTAADEMLVRTLYAEHAGPLLRYALHLTSGDRQRAEDIVQETLLRAWMHPDAIADRPARPWLFAVARNLAVDAYRARRARPHEVGEAALELVPAPDEAERALESWAVADAVKALRPDHRRVLLETYYRGKSVAEAAAAAWRSARYCEITDVLRAPGTQAGTRRTGARTMTELTDCGDIRRALGVYVVGAIDPAERATVDAHLPHCSDCREELAGLAGLPALLGRVPKEDAERLALGSEELEEAPAELLDSLLRQVAARRRARRWRGIAAAAAAAIIAVGGGIVGGAVIVAFAQLAARR